MKACIIGGTGTLGTELIKSLHKDNDITCFSRDELKQQKLKNIYPNVKYIIGDVRDKEAIKTLLNNSYDALFYVAALKHVDVLEDNPVEAIKTNVIGTLNIGEAAINAGVSNVVFSSTDKAVLPINVYGMSKSIAEKYLLNLNKLNKTHFSVYRWGNVIGSRGSAIHLFRDQLLNEKKVKITHIDMTRFWIPIETAVNYLLDTYKTASKTEIMIPTMKAAKIVRIVDIIAKLLNVRSYVIDIIGIRPGEKIHECLKSTHEYCIRSDTCEQYTDSEIVEFLKPVLGV